MEGTDFLWVLASRGWPILAQGLALCWVLASSC